MRPVLETFNDNHNEKSKGTQREGRQEQDVLPFDARHKMKQGVNVAQGFAVLPTSAICDIRIDCGVEILGKPSGSGRRGTGQTFMTRGLPKDSSSIRHP